MTDLDKTITKIRRRMGFKTSDEFEKYWAEENKRVGRPIPGHELERRRQLIRAAMNAEPENVSLLDRDPGEEG